MPKSKRSGRAAKPAGNDVSVALRRAGQMREEMLAAQKEIAELEISAEAGAPGVRVKINGRSELLEVKIDPQLFEDGDTEIIEDLIVAAFKKATDDLSVLTEEKMGRYASMIQGF